MDNDRNPDAEWVVPTILNRAEENGLKLEGPSETEYGFGWAPTSTFWIGDRRVHFYYDITGKHDAIEVADVNLNQVQRAAINDPDIAWEIIYRFLGKHCKFEELPMLDWKSDNLDHDKFIPHPPSVSNPGNIAQFIDKIKSMGAEIWTPSDNTNTQTSEDQ